MYWTFDVIVSRVVSSAPFVQRWGCQNQFHLTDQTICIHVRLHNSGKLPLVSSCSFILYYDNVSGVKVFLWFCPFGSALHFQEEFGSPSFPKFVCKVLYPSPALSRIQIRPLEYPRRGQHQLWLHRQKITWRQGLRWVHRLNALSCQRATVNYGFAFHEKSPQWFLI